MSSRTTVDAEVARRSTKLEDLGNEHLSPQLNYSIGTSGLVGFLLA